MRGISHDHFVSGYIHIMYSVIYTYVYIYIYINRLHNIVYMHVFTDGWKDGGMDFKLGRCWVEWTFTSGSFISTKDPLGPADGHNWNQALEHWVDIWPYLYVYIHI